MSQIFLNLVESASLQYPLGTIPEVTDIRCEHRPDLITQPTISQLLYKTINSEYTAETLWV
jgi:hypothetical protein